MRKILAITTIVALILTLFAGVVMANTSTNRGQSFNDINGHWANDAIKRMNSRGLIKGYEDGSFHPDGILTEAEAIVLIDRLVSDKVNQLTAEEDNNSVNDVANNDDTIPGWAKKSVNRATSEGTIDFKRFNSQAQYTRLQACVALGKALVNKGVITLPTDAPNYSPIKDQGLISAEDLPYIGALYQAGILKGNPDGSFNPNGFITRAEMAMLMDRVSG